jgi:hypothetical protein
MVGVTEGPRSPMMDEDDFEMVAAKYDELAEDAEVPVAS